MLSCLLPAMGFLEGVELLKLLRFRVWTIVARLVFGRCLKKAAGVWGPHTEKSLKHNGFGIDGYSLKFAKTL